MIRPRRGPILCDGGPHPALTPWIYLGLVLCPNCLLRAMSVAIRAGERIEAEPLEMAQERERERRRRPADAKVVRIQDGRK